MPFKAVLLQVECWLDPFLISLVDDVGSDTFLLYFSSYIYIKTFSQMKLLEYLEILIILHSERVFFMEFLLSVDQNK